MNIKMESIEQLARELEKAWSKYVKFFGQPPHGTFKQLHALLALGIDKYVQKLILRAENKVMDNILGECIAINPKTREIDTFITRKCLKAYEKQLQSELKSLEKEKDDGVA